MSELKVRTIYHPVFSDEPHHYLEVNGKVEMFWTAWEIGTVVGLSSEVRYFNMFSQTRVDL